MKRIAFIDSHTGGEPTRLIAAGGPDLGRGPLAERLRRLREEHDAYRRAAVNEPRGSDVMVGALLLEPQDAAAAAGVIFFNNVGYLGMCGHGTIGLIATLAHMGRLKPGAHTVETPVGNVLAELHEDGRVSVHNVPAYRHAKNVSVELDWRGERLTVSGDVAWGGNWFYLVNDPPVAFGLQVHKSRVGELTKFSSLLMRELAAAGISGEGGAVIDHIELFEPGEGAPAGADSRSFVLCPGNAYDRSPCGTGTSAKLACLAADGALEPGATWVQESVIGSRFTARYEWAPGGGTGVEGARVLPVITGTAHVMAEGELLLDPADEFAWGIP